MSHCDGQWAGSGRNGGTLRRSPHLDFAVNKRVSQSVQDGETGVLRQWVVVSTARNHSNRGSRHGSSTHRGLWARSGRH